MRIRDGINSNPVVVLQKEKEAAAAAEAASRKSSRPGKGRNPRLEREDEQIEIPKKVSHKRRVRADRNPKKGQSQTTRTSR